MAKFATYERKTDVHDISVWDTEGQLYTIMVANLCVWVVGTGSVSMTSRPYIPRAWEFCLSAQKRLPPAQAQLVNYFSQQK